MMEQRPMAAREIVRMTNVTKQFGALTVIENLNLAIRDGEFLTLLGPSGSGKTTTLMMLAGFEAPSSGTIELSGRRIESLPAYRRDIGVVFQNYALFPHLTVAENLAFPLSVRRKPKSEIEAKVKEALAKVRLSDLGARRPSQLSGGQQQRVALARALIFSPHLIVLDEPLGALDKNLREEMQLELKHLQQNIGITMVFVTHDQSEAMAMSDRIAVFNRGRIEQIAEPLQLYENPATTFVAGFVGESNMLLGQVCGKSGDETQIRLLAGETIVTKVTEALAVGTAVKVCIRPENIFLKGAKPLPSHLQTFAARVADVIYLGDQRRVIATSEKLGRIAIKLRSSDSLGILQGERDITIGFHTEKCRVFHGETG